LTPSASAAAITEPDAATSLDAIAARLRGEEPLPTAIAPKKYKTEKELAALRERMKDELGLLPREDENDTVIGGSPIFLSDQAREIISKLRRQKVNTELRGRPTV
jgi:hypothetical protein